MMRRSIAIKRMAQNGECGSQVKLIKADIAAKTIPAISAHPWPSSRQMPIATKASPINRWIQPQAVRSKV